MVYLICYLVWLGLGCTGWFLHRWGELNSFPSLRARGRAWTNGDNVMGLLSALVIGPIFIFIALRVSGKNCFRKPPKIK